MITKTRLRRNRRALNGRSAAALPFVTGNRYRTGPPGKERNDDDDMAFRNCTMGMAAVLLLIISVAVLPSRLLPRQGNAPISKGWGRELGDYGKPIVSYYALDDPAPPALGGDADRPFDCLIVGCGPGGLSAGLFAARMGMSTLLVGSPSSGSLMGTSSLGNFPSFGGGEDDGGSDGRAWINGMLRQVTNHEAKFVHPTLLATGLQQVGQDDASVIQVSLDTSAAAEASDKNHVFARTVIIASGSSPRRLNLANEGHLWGVSLHNCALCDGDKYIPAEDETKRVAVVGGGDAAVDAINLLLRLGIENIYWVHRRDQFKASNAVDVRRIMASSNVKVYTPYVVREWVSRKHDISQLQQIRIIRASNGVEDPDANTMISLPCDGAFLMLGSTPNTAFLERNTGVELSRGDHNILLRTNGDYSTATSLSGVFAAGDVADVVYRQALTASADGAKAAIDAQRYLQKKGLLKSHDKQKSGEKPMAVDKPHRPVALLDLAVGGPVVDARKNFSDCNLVDLSCVQQLIASNPVVVFSKLYCPHCTRALEALESQMGTNKPFVVELTEFGTEAMKIQKTVAAISYGRMTVPNVFISGKSIGGGDETMDLLREGKLKQMIMHARFTRVL